MSAQVVYVVPTPSSNRNVEMDVVAEALGSDAVYLVFLSGENVGASAPQTFPQICRYSCLDRPDDPESDAPPKLVPLLEELDPDAVIVSGYVQREMRQTIAWCRRNNIPYGLRTDGSIWTDRYKGWMKYLVRRPRLTKRVRTAKTCLIGGETNRLYWKRYGMQPYQEGWWPQWIEYDHFAKARQVDADEKRALLDKHGISTFPNFLYIGRHVALKNIDRLCDGLLACGPEVGLILVGGGPETEKIRERYGTDLQGRLHIVGHVTHEALPKWYAAADAFTLATGDRENWGMVVNEATTAGLAFICGEKVGSVGDLVIDGRNGVTLRTNSSEEWAQVMEDISTRPDELAAMGRESMIIADEWRERSDPAECVSAFIDSVL